MIPRKKILYAASAALVLAACADRPTEPNATSSSGNGAPNKPSFTPADRFTSILDGRGNLGTFHIQSKANGYDVELKSHDNTDIAVVDITVTPGGHSGWHYHPGPVLVVVKTGTITFYMGDDPSCSPQVHPAGTTFIEKGGMVGLARNQGEVNATVVATFFVPAGSPLRIDAPEPSQCPPDLDRIP
jgi:quercetin dioxygenase-like cupin family protein